MAGFDPHAGASLFERMAIEVPQSLTANFFSSHPSSPERWMTIQQHATTLTRGYLAQAQPQPCLAEELSAEQIFYGVQRELTAVSVPVPPAMVVSAYLEELSQDELCRRLHTLLASLWTPRWRKAVNTKPLQLGLLWKGAAVNADSRLCEY